MIVAFNETFYLTTTRMWQTLSPLVLLQMVRLTIMHLAGLKAAIQTHSSTRPTISVQTRTLLLPV